MSPCLPVFVLFLKAGQLFDVLMWVCPPVVSFGRRALW